mgnify:CR=1 FL=1
MTLQDLILKLSAFWASRGCLLQQPLDLEVGAGTSHPETLLRVLGPRPWNVAYVQPSRRPDDGRFGQNPNRLFKHLQLHQNHRLELRVEFFNLFNKDQYIISDSTRQVGSPTYGQLTQTRLNSQFQTQLAVRYTF